MSVLDLYRPFLVITPETIQSHNSLHSTVTTLNHLETTE
jgi:hypothetical protein